MSNNEWNNGQGQGEGQWQPQGDWNPAPQQSASDWDQGQQSQGQQGQDWNTGAQPQPSANDWNTGQQAQGWNTGAQPQPSANDWNTGQQAQGWNTGTQPPAGDWGGAQGWNAGATAHQQGWGDPNQQGGFAPTQQQWQPQQSKKPSAIGNVFDVSFRKFALPEAAGTIFLLSVIAIAVWWLMDLINTLTFAGGEFGVGVGSILQVLIGGLARSFLYILLARVIIEGMSALVTGSHASETDTAEVADKDPGAL